MVSFRSFTLFVYARFLRQSLIVVVRALLLLLLIHYFITVVLNYRRTLFKRSSRIISDIVLFSRKFPRFRTEKMRKRTRFSYKFFLILLQPSAGGVCFHVIFFSLSLSLDPGGQSHGDEEKNFDTFEEERDGLSLIRSTEAFWWSFLQQRVLRKGRSEKNSILFSTTIFNEESSLTPRASSALHSRRTPIRSRESRDSPLFCCVFSGGDDEERKLEDKIWEDLGFSSFG